MFWLRFGARYPITLTRDQRLNARYVYRDSRRNSGLDVTTSKYRTAAYLLMKMPQSN